MRRLQRQELLRAREPPALLPPGIAQSSAGIKSVLGWGWGSNSLLFLPPPPDANAAHNYQEQKRNKHTNGTFQAEHGDVLNVDALSVFFTTCT